MPKLIGCTILIVEDKALVAMVLVQAIQDEGGVPIACATDTEALLAINTTKLSAAILDNSICHAHPEVCQRLEAQGVPYVLHQNLTDVHGTGAVGSADALIDRVADLLKQSP